MKFKKKLRLGVGKLYVNTLSRAEELVYGAALNPFSEKLWYDPYTQHSKLREIRPIHYSIALKSYWVTRFDWVQEILRDKRFGADVRHHPVQSSKVTRNMDAEQLTDFNNPSMLDLDPPDHSRIRRLVSQGFMHKFVQSLEPRIREIVRSCLRPTDNEPLVDLVETLAKPLPAIVIAEMLGLPESDHAQFQAWSEDLISGSGTNDSAKLERSEFAKRQLMVYFRKIVAIKRQAPAEDLVSRLIAAEEEGDALTEIELLNTCWLLLVAGHETTTRLIGNGIYLLLKFPEQMRMLREDPTLIPTAVEEMLRYEPPVQATRRFVGEDLDFHGTRLKRGDFLFLSIAGANRDPRANPSPDVFDITRVQAAQISFGYGIHLCIGASLARLEAKVALEELLTRYERIALQDQQPAWGQNPFFRGLDQLNVKVLSNG